MFPMMLLCLYQQQGKTNTKENPMTTQTVTAKTINTDKLTQAGERLADVLDSEGVIGNYDNAKHNDFEKASFVRGLVDYVTSDDIRSYHEVTFTTCVRLIIKFDVVNNEAALRTVDAYDHPWKNEAINYERLNEGLHAVLNDVTT